MESGHIPGARERSRELLFGGPATAAHLLGHYHGAIELAARRGVRSKARFDNPPASGVVCIVRAVVITLSGIAGVRLGSLRTTAMETTVNSTSFSGYGRAACASLAGGHGPASLIGPLWGGALLDVTGPQEVLQGDSIMLQNGDDLGIETDADDLALGVDFVWDEISHIVLDRIRSNPDKGG